MRFSLLFLSLLIAAINTTAQTADNGLNISSPNNVQLGGSLLKTTIIDQSSFNFQLRNGSTPIFTSLANGNIGFGTATPEARITFPDAGYTTEASGISWSKGSFVTTYGIHRTAGPWESPNYQQLRLGWETGIILDPGNQYGKSYVDIKGNGLRVTEGNVGIGTTAPTEKLQVNGTVSSNGFRLNAGNSLYWGDLNTSITRVENVLTLKEYTGQINLTGVGNVNVALTHPTYGSANFLFPSYKLFALRQGNAYVFQTSTANQDECWIKVGSPTPQFADANGTRLYLTGGKGGERSGYNGGDVFIDGGERGGGTVDGNILIGTQFGKVGIGITSPTAQLHTTGTVRFAGLTNDNAKDRVIVSDANGNLSYRDASSLGGSSTAGWSLTGNNDANAKLGTIGSNDLPFITGNVEQMRIGANGNVGIGTTAISGNYKLSVEGTIRTRKVRVDPGTWADYVFESDYKLRPLKEVERYIQQEKHLPEMPSAAEVKKEGLDVGDNQALLLKKIEELTLYVIQQQKQLEAQQQKIENLEKKVNEKK